MTENAVLTTAKPIRVRSGGAEWATLIFSIVAALAVAINPAWGLLFAFAALALTLLHLLRRVGRLSWMVASLCVSGLAIVLGIGYLVTSFAVHEEVGIDYSGNRDLPGDFKP